MTTPADNTPISIIDDAYHDAGIVMEGDSVSSEQIVVGMRKLTDLINIEQTQGVKLWLNVDTSVTLVASQAKYTFKPSGDVSMVKPLRVIQGYFLDTNSIRSPLSVLSWDEYLRLSQVSGNTGAVNSYFVDKQATELDVYFWLTPDATAATGTAHVLLQTQVTGPISVTETMNFPIEWRMFLRWGLADEICTGQPQSIMDRCQGRAAMYKDMLEGWDVEDAPTRFTPDQRASQGTGRFR